MSMGVVVLNVDDIGLVCKLIETSLIQILKELFFCSLTRSVY